MPSLDLDPILDTLRKLNAGFTAAAKLTPTVIDDEVCAGLQAILDSPALIAFFKLLAGDSDAVAHAASGNHAAFAAHVEATATPEVREAVTAAGFDFQKWLKIAMTVFQLLQPFLKK